MQQQQVIPTKKRSLISTTLLMLMFLKNSPRKNSPEEEFQQVAAAWLDPEWEGASIIKPHIDQLIDQGYLTDKLEVTPFGQKMALQATNNTPDFERIASSGINLAFAMLFAASKALETHLAEQPQIVPGDGGGDRLVNALKAHVDFINSKLNGPEEPKKSAKKK